MVTGVAGAVRVGIIGGSGYTGAELLRLCAGHPDLDVAWATGDTRAGTRIAALGLPTVIVMEGGYAVGALGQNVAALIERI